MTKRGGRAGRTGTLGAASLLCALALPSPAGAKTFEPTRHGDPPPGKCMPDDCSLREAISAANAREGNDKVVLGAGTYRIGLSGGEDDNESDDFDVAGPTAIKGKGPRRTTVDADGKSRVFEMDAPTSVAVPQSITGLRMVNGDVSAGQGSGVLARDTLLTLRHVDIRDQDGEEGGGVYSSAPKLEIVNSTIRDNPGALLGGGVFARSELLSIRRSTIANNSAESGGGLYVPAADPAPQVEIIASTISGNLATAGLGAGIYLDGAAAASDPDLHLINSTISDNGATVSGGGISAILGANANIDSTTIAYNGADSDDSGGGDGGGIYQSSGAAVTVDASLLASNEVGATGLGFNCAEGTAGGIAGVNNAVGDPGTDECGLAGAYGPDASIGPLGKHGGPTKTIPLLDGSLAIGNVGIAGLCPPSDQRGKERPETACDAGAFERQKP